MIEEKNQCGEEMGGAHSGKLGDLTNLKSKKPKGKMKTNRR